ncbi:MAG: hypothetical protein OCD76_07445, partial [Reichenbachiella sp.]
EGESNVLSSFPKSMGDFNKDYKRSDGVNIDKNSFYLFLLPGTGDGRSGFMPFKRQFGYIWTGNTGSNAAQTIAHELGHGAFRLRHTFSTSGSAFVAGEGTTDNLMDYSNGDALYKHQWDFVHDPESMNGWMQEDAESADILYTYDHVVSKEDAWLREEIIPYSFISPTEVVLPALQVALMEVIEVNESASVAKIKIKESGDIVYTTYSNLEKVTSVEDETFKFKGAYIALATPYGIEATEEKYELCKGR